MSMGNDTTWVGKKPIRRIGGMSDALSIAADLGFSVASPPSQVSFLSYISPSGYPTRVAVFIDVLLFNSGLKRQKS
jgi:hypothetical protein